MKALFADQTRCVLEEIEAVLADADDAEASRILCHALEALENYYAHRPPPNYGANLKYGKRSGGGGPLSKTEVAEYLSYVGEFCQARLEEVADFEKVDAWGWVIANRLFYALRHAQHHIGQISHGLRERQDDRSLAYCVFGGEWT